MDPIGEIPGKVREYYKLLHMHYTGNIIKVRKERKIIGLKKRVVPLLKRGGETDGNGKLGKRRFIYPLPLLPPPTRQKLSKIVRE